MIFYFAYYEPVMALHGIYATDCGTNYRISIHIAREPLYSRF